jgi:APA family basic amino acid/polyamine antiporter
MWGTVGTVLLSAAACASVLLIVPAARLAGAGAPFAELVRPAWGDASARVVSMFAAISALGALNGWILLQGELPRAMAEDGLFVRAFARTSSRGAPVVALVATSCLVTLLVLLNVHRTLVGVFTFFVLLATTATLVAYLACSLALFRLRAGVAAKSMAALGVTGALYSLAALAGAGKEAVLWGTALLAAGLPVYFAVHHFGSRFPARPEERTEP